MSFFGEDFSKARTAWLYPKEPLQGPWRAFFSFLLLLALYFFLGTLVFTPLIDVLVFHADANTFMAMRDVINSGGSLKGNKDFVNIEISNLLATFPAGVLIAFIALPVSHFGLPNRQGHLPLHWPSLGILGWFTVLFIFIFVMNLAAALVTIGFGVEIGNYEVCKDGALDAASKAGEVERAVAQLARDKGLFIFAALAAVIGAPLAEEVLFRGILFAGIAGTRLGGAGAVIITAALWALLHGASAPWLFVAIIFPMGLVLGLLLLRFGSLVVTIACHMLWNGIFIAATLASCVPK